MQYLPILFIPFLTWISRLTGGLPPSLPWKLEQLLFGLPFALVGLFALNWQAALACWLCATLVKITGHGQWMVLPYSFKATEMERLDFLLLPFFGKDPRTRKEVAHLRGIHEDNLTIKEKQLLRSYIDTYLNERGENALYYRNLAGLGVNSLVLGLATTVSLAIGQHWIACVLFTLVNSLSFVGYYIGWFHLEGTRTFLTPKAEATEWGEAFRGFFAGLATCISLILVL